MTTQNKKILVINPGGTSTKMALFDGDVEVASQNIRHCESDFEILNKPMDQFALRLATVREFLEDNHISLASLSAVVGRGGPIVPMPSGTFLVDNQMLEEIKNDRVMVQHASLLGAPLAAAIASSAGGIPAYIVDPVCVDEMLPEAKLSGLPQTPRAALSHALSVKAVSRKAASQLGRPLNELNLIVAHLGSGFTVAAQRQGCQIDHNDPTASGPMSPTRAGDLPAVAFARFCDSSNFDLSKIERMLVQEGGWRAHLGTDDVREVYSLIDNGSKEARLVLDATIFQLNKEIGGIFAILQGQVHALVVSGGVAKSDRFIAELKGKLAWFQSPILLFVQESEMEALAMGANRILNGVESVKRIETYLHY